MAVLTPSFAVRDLWETQEACALSNPQRNPESPCCHGDSFVSPRSEDMGIVDTMYFLPQWHLQARSLCDGREEASFVSPASPADPGMCFPSISHLWSQRAGLCSVVGTVEQSKVTKSHCLEMLLAQALAISSHGFTSPNTAGVTTHSLLYSLVFRLACNSTFLVPGVLLSTESVETWHYQHIAVSVR